MELLGYNVPAYKTAIFSVCGAMAGLAGCLFANWAEIVTPSVFSLGTTAEVLIWVIVGGLGTLIGPMIAAVALGSLKLELGHQTTVDNSLVLGAILILVVLLDPARLCAELRCLAPALCAIASPSPAGARHAPPPHRAAGSQTVSEPVVETQELAVRFGGVLAVDHVNFVLRERELRCLIGPNGAGKSTFFKSHHRPNPRRQCQRPGADPRPGNYRLVDAQDRAARHRHQDAGAIGDERAHRRGKSMAFRAPDRRA